MKNHSQHRNTLAEAIRRMDLRGCIQPLISIDEYQPKTGRESEVIVVTFYANDEDPARDLKRFLDKSFVEILDSDVSPNSDEHGKYLVFVEFKRDGSFWDDFFSIVKEVENLTGKLDWQVKPYLSDTAFDIEQDSWESYVITDSSSYMTKAEFEAAMSESIRSFFSYTDVDDVDMNEGRLRITNFGKTSDFVFEAISTQKSAQRLIENSAYATYLPVEIRRLQSALGPSCELYLLKEKIVLQNQNKDILILRRYE